MGAFAISSVLTPFFMGTVVGAVASGRVPIGNAEGDAVTSWLNPVSLLIGVLFVVTGAYLAAVFLVSDARRFGDADLERYFAVRALAAAAVAGAVAVAGILVLRSDARYVYDGLVSEGLPLVIVSAACGVAALILLWRGARRGLRPLAVGAVVAVIWGWGAAQYPYLLPTTLTIEDGAASSETLTARARRLRRRRGRRPAGARAAVHAHPAEHARGGGARHSTAPSGEQIEIVHGDQRAVVVEVGGGLRTYSAGGREVLDGYRYDEMSTSGRGQVLIPWPNRIQDGSYEFAGRRHQLPLDDVEEQDAIHGLVRWSPWTVAARTVDRVVMEHVIHPRPGYPFLLAIAIEYALSDEGLRVRTTAVNHGTGACPYGSGAHPYLAAGAPSVDSVVLRVPARTMLRSDERGIPVGSASVEGTDYDFRRPRPIGETKLDNCFTDLERDVDGRARVQLRSPERGDELVLWMDETYQYVMLFTGDPLPDVDRRSLAVEPMTCPPNAFRSGEALIHLEPGEAFTSVWGLGQAP